VCRLLNKTEKNIAFCQYRIGYHIMRVFYKAHTELRLMADGLLVAESCCTTVSATRCNSAVHVGRCVVRFAAQLRDNLRQTRNPLRNPLRSSKFAQRKSATRRTTFSSVGILTFCASDANGDINLSVQYGKCQRSAARPQTDQT